MIKKSNILLEIRFLHLGARGPEILKVRVPHQNLGGPHLTDKAKKSRGPTPFLVPSARAYFRPCHALTPSSRFMDPGG